MSDRNRMEPEAPRRDADIPFHGAKVIDIHVSDEVVAMLNQKPRIRVRPASKYIPAFQLHRTELSKYALFVPPYTRKI